MILNINFSNIDNKSNVLSTQNNNDKILRALQNKSFSRYVVNNLNKQITHLNLWGLEPAINGRYFINFIEPILIRYPSIHYISLTTNGLLPLVNSFIAPLNMLANKLKQKLILIIYIKLDGPEQLQDQHYGIGDYRTICANLDNLFIKTSRLLNQQGYLRLKVFNESSLNINDLSLDYIAWNMDMQKIQQQYQVYESYTIKCKMTVQPTLAFSSNYTKENGQQLCKWKNHIRLIPPCKQQCALTSQVKCVNYNGASYKCPFCVNQPILNMENRKQIFNERFKKLKAEKEILPTIDDRKLWVATNKLHCYALEGNIISDSLIKLLGNGIIL